MKILEVEEQQQPHFSSRGCEVARPALSLLLHARASCMSKATRSCPPPPPCCDWSSQEHCLVPGPSLPSVAPGLLKPSFKIKPLSSTSAMVIMLKIHLEVRPQLSFSNWHTCVDLFIPYLKNCETGLSSLCSCSPQGAQSMNAAVDSLFCSQCALVRLWQHNPNLPYTLPSDVLRSFMVKAKYTIRSRGTTQHRWKGAHWGRIPPLPFSRDSLTFLRVWFPHPYSLCFLPLVILIIMASFLLCIISLIIIVIIYWAPAKYHEAFRAVLAGALRQEKKKEKAFT